MPISSGQLQPQWSDLKDFREKDEALKQKQQQNYNRRHRTQTLPPLPAGQKVWVMPTKAQGTVVGPAPTPRSYVVDTPGGQLRRNRSHLRVVPEPQVSLDTNTTRSGRVSKAPVRLDL